MSQHGKRVLHIDKNGYYGGESASISPLQQVRSHKLSISIHAHPPFYKGAAALLTVCSVVVVFTAVQEV